MLDFANKLKDEYNKKHAIIVQEVGELMEFKVLLEYELRF